MQIKRSNNKNERKDETKIKSLAMMVKRNTPARLRQKRGASARSEAKNKARNASPLPDKAPFVKHFKYLNL